MVLSNINKNSIAIKSIGPNAPGTNSEAVRKQDGIATQDAYKEVQKKIAQECQQLQDAMLASLKVIA